ncbi:TrbI/VirB10 family protein [Okeania sp. SIO2B3]|uniref:TrbI/VirB10 family protein n=1 Tax=Okeania sp. SIO2B3 TaxID=2607784 RepID=UPI0013BEEB36|nr:TrbI/VirB10 family protein [Okeania sp. SIO2B3]NET45883.1 TrbI/VirB10 family protein [Okeania sp. SIO2B3]
MKLYDNNTSQSTNGHGSSVFTDTDDDLTDVDKLVGVESNSAEEDEEDESLLGDIDLQETQKTTKRKSLAISKIIVILGGTGVFALFAYLMFGGMKGVNKTVHKIAPKQAQEETIDPLEQAKQNHQKKEAELQTELALGTQQRELSDKKKRNTKIAETVEMPSQKEEPVVNPEPKTPPTTTTPPTTNKTQSQQNTAASSRQRTPRRQAYNPPPRRTAPVERRSPPAPIPPPPRPLPSPVERRSYVPPPPTPPTPPRPLPSPVKKRSPPDPQVQIAKAMSYGNYGQMDYSNIDLTPTPEPTQIIAKAETETKQIIAPGQIVDGILNTPIFWVEDLDLEAQPQRFAIESQNPLYDSEGEVMIPEKSLLLARLKNTSKSGMVILEISGAVSTDRKVVKIPDNTLSITSHTGSPLIAQSKRQRGGKQNLRLFIMAGLSRMGQLLNRADSKTTYSGFGGVSSHSQHNDNPNLLGAILEGAFGEMHRQASNFESEELEKILDRPFIWVIEAGEKVKIFVNNSDW